MINEPADSESMPPRARVTLRKVSTGEVWTYIDDWTTTNPDLCLHNVFWQWSEGNYACDCNRHRQWLRSQGKMSEANLSEFPCGDDVEYVLIGFEAAL